MLVLVALHAAGPYIGKSLLSVNTYKQMSGRAGRKGFGSTYGECILVCPQASVDKVSDALLSAPVSNCMSSLDGDDGVQVRRIALWLVATKTAQSVVAVRAWFALTLLAVQYPDR